MFLLNTSGLALRICTRAVKIIMQIVVGRGPIV